MSSLRIEPTENFYMVGGTLCRVWKGTEGGKVVYAFVALLAVPPNADGSVVEELDPELVELARTDPASGAHETHGFVQFHGPAPTSTPTDPKGRPS